MRTVLQSLLTLVWGLWFGGVAALFVAVTAIFRAFSSDRDTAALAATYVFHSFNRYQLGLAAGAVLGSFVCAIWKRGKLKAALFCLFGMAAFDACIVARYVAPAIEKLSIQGLTHTPEFARLHGYSMMLYLAEMVMLLIAGLMLPWLRRLDATVEKGQ
jgi:hypothetical protein